jgi:hypothetical protein
MTSHRLPIFCVSAPPFPGQKKHLSVRTSLSLALSRSIIGPACAARTLDPIRARGANFLPHRQVDANFILQLHARTLSLHQLPAAAQARRNAPTLSLQLAPPFNSIPAAFLALSEHPTTTQMQTKSKQRNYAPISICIDLFRRVCIPLRCNFIWECVCAYTKIYQNAICIAENLLLKSPNLFLVHEMDKKDLIW